MDVRIGGWVWLPKLAEGVEGLKPTDVEAIRKALTILPRATSDIGEARGEMCLWKETDTHLGVPRAWYRKNVTIKHNEILDVSYGDALSKECIAGGFKGSDAPPFQEQPIALEAISQAIQHPWGGALLNAACAFGKTASALRFIYKKGRTALVIVNKDFFMDQWTEEIKFFLPGAKIGYIQGPTCDVKGKDIVIGMVHSLTQKEYPEWVYRAFGTIVVDECHGTGSETFSTVLPKFYAAYRLGISATPHRKDGCESAYLYNIGEIAYKAKSETLIPSVMVVSGPEVKGKRKWGKFKSIEEMNSAEVDSQVAVDKQHNEMVMAYTLRAAQRGRKVIVLSSRMEQLGMIYGMMRAANVPYTIGWVTGKQPILDKDGNLQGTEDSFLMATTKKEELEAANRCQILLATKQLISEGYNNQAIDTMVFAMPQSDIVQLVGRIRRHCKPTASKCPKLCPWRAGQCQEKPEPTVVDILNENRRFHGKFRYRLEYYQGIKARLLLDEKAKKQYPELVPKTVVKKSIT